MEEETLLRYNHLLRAGAILCFVSGNDRALISPNKSHSLIFTSSLVRLVEQNDCRISFSLLQVWCEWILFPGWEIKVEVSTSDLQLAISRVLSTFLRQIIFIASLLLPGAVTMKKQFGEPGIVLPADGVTDARRSWWERGGALGDGGDAAQ